MMPSARSRDRAWRDEYALGGPGAGERKALSPDSGRLLEVDLVLALHGREIKAVPHALAHAVVVGLPAAVHAVERPLRREPERVMVVVVVQEHEHVVVGVDEIARALGDLAGHEVRAAGEGERPLEDGDIDPPTQTGLLDAGG